MSYQAGRMGIAEGLALVSLAVMPRVFLSAPAQLLAQAATAAWLTVLIGGVATLVVLLVMLYIVSWMQGDLFTACERLLGRLGAWLVSFLCMAAFFINAVLFLRQYAENTLLTALPALSLPVAVGWYALAAAIVAYYGIEAIARAAYLIVPFIVAGVMIVVILLAPFYRVYNLAPWFGFGVDNTIITGLTAAGFAVSALVLPVLAPLFRDRRTLQGAALFGLGGGILVKAIVVLAFTMAFDVAVGQEKTLPFFEMARLVYISRYLQRIEAFFIILWVIVGLMSIAINLYIALYLYTRLFQLPTMRPLIAVMVLIAAELALLPPEVVSVLKFDYTMVRYFAWGLYGLQALLLAMILLKRRKRLTCSR